MAEIKSACPAVTPVLLRQGATNYRLAHPSWELTPSALAKHWHTLGVTAEVGGGVSSRPEPDWEDTGGPPPENWREVLCAVERVGPELVAGREWESFTHLIRLGVLREIHRRAQNPEGRAAA